MKKLFFLAFVFVAVLQISGSAYGLYSVSDSMAKSPLALWKSTPASVSMLMLGLALVSIASFFRHQIKK